MPFAWTARLRDRRSGKVVFLSHCLLNENTRYLGGACRAGCVREIVAQCLDRGIGMVQMPCPEQDAWGGVLKTKMLALYGAKRERPLLHHLQRALLPLYLLHYRWRCRALARRTAAAIADYLASGFAVLGVVAVDGSPSCGLRNTIDLRAACDAVAAVDRRVISTDEHNALLRRHVREGRGLFVAALARELSRHRLPVRLLAHDLFEELEGRASSVELESTDRFE